MINNYEDEEYYHGLLPREDLPHLLKTPGDFLLRISQPKVTEPRQIIISLAIGAAPNVSQKKDSDRRAPTQTQAGGMTLSQAQAPYTMYGQKASGISPETAPRGPTPNSQHLGSGISQSGSAESTGSGNLLLRNSRMLSREGTPGRNTVSQLPGDPGRTKEGGFSRHRKEGTPGSVSREPRMSREPGRMSREPTPSGMRSLSKEPGKKKAQKWMGPVGPSKEVVRKSRFLSVEAVQRSRNIAPSDGLNLSSEAAPKPLRQMQARDRQARAGSQEPSIGGSSQESRLPMQSPPTPAIQGAAPGLNRNGGKENVLPPSSQSSDQKDLLRAQEGQQPGQAAFNQIANFPSLESNSNAQQPPIAITHKHFVVQNKGEKFSVDGTIMFDTISELISEYRGRHMPLNKDQPNTILVSPVRRAAWELLHEHVVTEKKLGQGAFGDVYQGKLKHATGEIDVAVKVAKSEEMNKEKIKEVMKEARLMRNYDHPNVVRLYGVAVEKEPLMIVMELINGGALDEYLKKVEVSGEEKLSMIQGAAWGIEYLHFQKCIHRDLAARNCLYATVNNEKVVKISDFGLSREGEKYSLTQARMVPIKWLAPETITTLVYTPKSDVWSYGVLVWEVYANGEEPYLGLTNGETKQKVLSGYRMEFHPSTPPEVLDVVKKMCWESQPDRRSSMSQVARRLEQITGMCAPQQQVSLRRKVDSRVPTGGIEYTGHNNRPVGRTKSSERSTSGTGLPGPNNFHKQQLRSAMTQQQSAAKLHKDTQKRKKTTDRTKMKPPR